MPGAGPQFAETLHLRSGQQNKRLRGRNLGYPDHVNDAGLVIDGTGSGDHWYEFSLASANVLTARMVASFDCHLILRAGPCASSTAVAADDNSGPGESSLLSNRALAAGTHCLIANGDDADGVNEGDYELLLQFNNPL